MTDPLVNSLDKFSQYITHYHDKFLSFGRVYTISKRISIPASGVGGGILNIIVDPSLCECDTLMYLPAQYKAYGAGPIYVDLYGGATYTKGTGTALASQNRNPDGPSAQLYVEQAPTVLTDGTKAPIEYTIFSNSGGSFPQATSISGGTSDEMIFVGDKNQVAMFRLTNQENETCTYAYLYMSWVEIFLKDFK